MCYVLFSDAVSSETPQQFDKECNKATLLHRTSDKHLTVDAISSGCREQQTSAVDSQDLSKYQKSTKSNCQNTCSNVQSSSSSSSNKSRKKRNRRNQDRCSSATALDLRSDVPSGKNRPVETVCEIGNGGKKKTQKVLSNDCVKSDSSKSGLEKCSQPSAKERRAKPAAPVAKSCDRVPVKEKSISVVSSSSSSSTTTLHISDSHNSWKASGVKTSSSMLIL